MKKEPQQLLWEWLIERKDIVEDELDETKVRPIMATTPREVYKYVTRYFTPKK